MFGPGILFVIWGVVQWVASNPRGPIKNYPWKHAIDSMGWLYVAAGMAVPCALDCFRNKVFTTMSISVAIGGLLCIGLLLAGMTERARSTQWQPSRVMLFFAGLLAVGVLIVGYTAHETVRKMSSTGVGASEDENGGGK